MSTEPTATTAPQGPGASHAFQAEVSRLLDLMVHSVYTDKEVFLRELISNASDACDKLRYEAISRAELLGADARLAISISIDKDAKRLTVADNGIGMSEGELIDNLGTVARSGTRAFLDRIDAAKEGGSQIGQFGVGFYAAFMVADEIEVLTRKAGETQAWLWVSKGADGFTVSPAPADRTLKAASGTEVRLTLKDDAQSYLDEHEIERIVRTYSDDILFPIEIAGADGTTRQVNTASALWRRSKSEVKPEDYKQVYQRVAGQFDEPALTLHYSAEGRQSYCVLLFVPSQRPYDLFDPARKGTVKLYVRRVYITEDAALLPSYLRFVKGVIDSEDMPLNISREMLQNNPTVAQIRRAVTSRLLSELETTATKDAERYTKIWATFGAVIKEGIYEDFERRDQLMKLARFRSTATPALAEAATAEAPTSWRSLADYVAAMRPNQSEIYYLIGDNLDRLRASPQLEAARARGIEVLLLTDPVDSFWTTMAPRFDGKDFKSLTQGDVDVSKVALVNEEAPKTEANAESTSATVAAIKTALGDTVADVRISQRLVDSASCLVAPGGGPDRGLAKIMQRQQSGAAAKPVLEVNPSHALVQAVGRANGDGRKDEATDLAWLLLDQAMVLEGELPHDPAKFAARLNRLVLKSLPAA